MSRFIEVKENTRTIYNIYIENSYDYLNNIFDMEVLHKKKVCIISDTTISPFYMDEVVKKIGSFVKKVETFIISPGEEYKNLDTVNQVYEYLIQCDFERSDLLIALGGGVVGDLTGFVAATYLRGIDFIQMPTTLLSMVDSSVGGKTGVDFLSYKNMIGAFHQPKAVYINTSVLNTLSPEQYYSGFGEIIKYGLIRDEDFYSWLKKNNLSLLNKELFLIEEMIYKSCVYKQNIVELDPTEQNERALLNFGHTLGHSIEKLMKFKLLHGTCVAIGMIAASYISFTRGNITKAQLKDIESTLINFNLPTRALNLNIEEILAGTKKDKKIEAGKIKFILLESIGCAVIDKNISDEEMKNAIKYIVNIER
jgi:3-dehydroquinate synthase